MGISSTVACQEVRNIVRLDSSGFVFNMNIIEPMLNPWDLKKKEKKEQDVMFD